MDPLHLAIALGPIAVYFLVLGAVNLSRRPLVTGGARDAAALGVAVSGCFAAGPFELFLPQAAAERFGANVWLLLLALYVLSLALLVLLMRPRIVIYNMTVDRLRPILGGVAKQLDEDARWAGESLTLPELNVHLHLEPNPALRNVQLIANGPRQNYANWRRLEADLARALRQERVEPNPYGGTLVLFGMLITGLIFYMTLSNQEAVAQALAEMLRL